MNCPRHPQGEVSQYTPTWGQYKGQLCWTCKTLVGIGQPGTNKKGWCDWMAPVQATVSLPAGPAPIKELWSTRQGSVGLRAQAMSAAIQAACMLYQGNHGPVEDVMRLALQFYELIESAERGEPTIPVPGSKF